MTRFARPAGSLFATLTVCPTGCASCRTPVGGSHPPAVMQHAKKKPAFSCELFFKYGGEGGIDSLRSPFGQPVRFTLSLSNWLRQLSNPVGGSHPPAVVQHAKKKPAFSCELFLKYGGEGGIDSLRSPCGQPVRFAHSLSNWLRQLSNPGRGFSSPPAVVQHAKKKARIFMRALLQIWR